MIWGYPYFWKHPYRKQNIAIFWNLERFSKKVQIDFCVFFFWVDPLFERLSKNRQERSFWLVVEPPIWKIWSSNWVHLTQFSGWKLPPKKCELPPAIGIYCPQSPSTCFSMPKSPHWEGHVLVRSEYSLVHPPWGPVVSRVIGWNQ